MKKLSIIVSKGSLDWAYPGLILASAARNNGVDVSLFFTFWGMDIITKKKVKNLKISPVGNVSMPFPEFMKILPGMTALTTAMMKSKIKKIDIPEVYELIQLIHDMGAKLYACKMAAEMMGLKREDLIDEVDDIIGANEFIYVSKDAEIIFI